MMNDKGAIFTTILIVTAIIAAVSVTIGTAVYIPYWVYTVNDQTTANTALNIVDIGQHKADRIITVEGIDYTLKEIWVPIKVLFDAGVYGDEDLYVKGEDSTLFVTAFGETFFTITAIKEKDGFHPDSGRFFEVKPGEKIQGTSELKLVTYSESFEDLDVWGKPEEMAERTFTVVEDNVFVILGPMDWRGWSQLKWGDTELNGFWVLISPEYYSILKAKTARDKATAFNKLAKASRTLSVPVEKAKVDAATVTLKVFPFDTDAKKIKIRHSSEEEGKFKEISSVETGDYLVSLPQGPFIEQKEEEGVIYGEYKLLVRPHEWYSFAYQFDESHVTAIEKIKAEPNERYVIGLNAAPTMLANSDVLMPKESDLENVVDLGATEPYQSFSDQSKELDEGQGITYKVTVQGYETFPIKIKLSKLNVLGNADTEFTVDYYVLTKKGEKAEYEMVNSFSDTITAVAGVPPQPLTKSYTKKFKLGDHDFSLELTFVVLPVDEKVNFYSAKVENSGKLKDYIVENLQPGLKLENLRAWFCNPDPLIKRYKEDVNWPETNKLRLQSRLDLPSQLIFKPDATFNVCLQGFEKTLRMKTKTHFYIKPVDGAKREIFKDTKFFQWSSLTVYLANIDLKAKKIVWIPAYEGTETIEENFPTKEGEYEFIVELEFEDGTKLTQTIEDREGKPLRFRIAKERLFIEAAEGEIGRYYFRLHSDDIKNLKEKLAIPETGLEFYRVLLPNLEVIQKGEKLDVVPDIVAAEGETPEQANATYIIDGVEKGATISIILKNLQDPKTKEYYADIVYKIEVTENVYREEFRE